MKIKIKDGNKDVGKKNRERVRKWFIDNPDTTQADCIRGTRLSKETVRKHIKAINNGE